MANCTSDIYKFNLRTIDKCACQTMHAWFVCLQKGWLFQQYADHVMPLISKRTVLFTDRYNPEYYDFVVVRNPFARLVSGYFDKIANPKEKTYYNPKYKTFKEWVMSLKPGEEHKFDPHFRPISLILKGKVFDKICKVETLQKDMDEVCERLDIPKQEMHDSKDKIRTYKQPYYTYYDEETLEHFMKMFEADFDLLDYSKELPEE